MLDTQATVEKLYHLRPTEVAFLTAIDHFNHLGLGGETRVGQKLGKSWAKKRDRFSDQDGHRL